MTLELVEQVVAEDMLVAYCAQRADAHGYRCMLAIWREASPELDMASVIRGFLLALDEI